MLEPKKFIHRKPFKPAKRKGVAKGSFSLEFGEFGLKAQSSGWVTNRAIEAARKVIVSFLKKGGKYWIRVFPDRIITKHGEKQGGGKGALDRIIADVKGGNMLFEISGISKEQAYEALKLASYKLCVKSKIVDKSIK